MKYDDLAALSPVVRKEVLTGELNRRVQALGIVEAEEIDSIVNGIANLSLSVIVQTLDNPEKLKEQVELRAKGPIRDVSEKAGSLISASLQSSTSDLNAANATASAPEHPSTPISVSATLSTPPRTSSPSGSVPPVSERDRIYAAVNKFENSRQLELTELLMGLPKRERAMCLFNPEVLRVKLVDAKAILDSEEEEAEEQAKAPAPPVQQNPVTPRVAKVEPPPTVDPATPELSSRGPSARASPLPITPDPTTTTPSTTSAYTMASLAKLPAAEIVRLAQMSSTTGLPIPKADPLVIQATDEFIDGILQQSNNVQKQKVGDKL